MKLLLDSQVLVWLLHDSKRIGQQSMKLIDDASTVYVSTMSFWELAIKFGKNKTRMPYSPDELLAGAQVLGLARLQILDKHILQLQSIVTPHSDPFDRILLAQSEAEGCHLLTSDKYLLNTKYPTLSVTE